MATPKEQIQNIRELIKSGKRQQAMAKLARMIERQPRNAELWWLLANATEDIDQARRALEEVLTLKPGDSRAQAMLDRLEARAVLSQMGVRRQVTPDRGNRRLMVFVAFVVLFGVVAAVLILVSGGARDNGTAIVEQPTLLLLPTETATSTPTETPIPTATDAPTDTPAPTTPPTEPPAPEVTADFVMAAESTAEIRQSAQVMMIQVPEFLPEFTPDVRPESTADPIFGSQSADFAGDEEGGVLMPRGVSPNPLILNPPNTILTNPFNTGSQTLGADPAATITGSLTYQPRGQVVQGRPVQEIIKPYDLHGWTFSGFRGEQISLELVNITGDGNPSLLLINDLGEVIAQDVDLVSGNNRTAFIALALPSDGIYTAVVRMASVNEQLYYLALRRGAITSP